MERREFITYTLSAGALSGLAGCTYQGITVGGEETSEADDAPTEVETTAAETADAETTAAETTEAETTEAETTEAGTTEAGAVGAEVDVGPEGSYLRFVPERVEISVGESVVWTARSEGHNVSADPDVARQVELPEGAESFASYPEGESYRILAVDETFQHTFTVPGEYVYVCVPHVGEGMIGTVIVQ